MAYVTLPLTGTGDASAKVATDQIVDEHYQFMKLVDGTVGSTVAVVALSSAPNSTHAGLVVRNIPSGTQQVSGTVVLDNSTAAIGVVTADLSSAGSTRLVGQMTVANPTTAIDLSSGGSTRLIGRVDINSGTTIVDANLTSVGSTRVVGTVGVSSGVVLGPSTAAIGQLTSGTQTIGSVQLTSAGTTGSIGSVALLSGSSGNVIGAAAQGPGSSANYWHINSLPFSSGNFARTTVNTSADASIIAANANRKSLIIQNLTTVDVGLGLTTAATSTALANVSIIIGGRGGANISNAIFGSAGQYPLYTGPIRGITIGATTVSGGVSVVEFS